MVPLAVVISLATSAKQSVGNMNPNVRNTATIAVDRELPIRPLYDAITPCVDAKCSDAASVNWRPARLDCKGSRLPELVPSV